MAKPTTRDANEIEVIAPRIILLHGKPFWALCMVGLANSPTMYVAYQKKIWLSHKFNAFSITSLVHTPAKYIHRANVDFILMGFWKQKKKTTAALFRSNER